MPHNAKNPPQSASDNALSDDDLDLVSGGTAGAPVAENSELAAREAGSGLATGKRQHGSVKITKEWNG